MVREALGVDAGAAVSAFAWDPGTRMWLATDRLSRIPSLYSPVGLWHGDGDLLDSSGNGNDLSVVSGTARYLYLGSSLRVCYLRSTILRSLAASLVITGDVTIAMAMQLHNTSATDPIYLFAHGDTGTGEATNNLYAASIRTTGLRWLSEHGSGVADSFDIPYALPIQQWGLFTARRASNVVTYRWNDVALPTPGTPLTTPTGGASAGLHIGGLPSTTYYAEMSFIGLAVYAAALSDAEISNLAQITFGREYDL